MEKNGVHADRVPAVPGTETADVAKELARLRARLAEIASMMRRIHGRQSKEVQLAEEVSAAVQRLESQLLGCPSAQFE